MPKLYRKRQSGWTVNRCYSAATMKTLLLLALLLPATAHADKSLDKSGAWDCAKDPVVHIGNGKGKYTFKGTCTTIDVGGGQNTLTIEAVDTLSVGGAKNTITVG